MQVKVRILRGFFSKGVNNSLYILLSLPCKAKPERCFPAVYAVRGAKLWEASSPPVPARPARQDRPSTGVVTSITRTPGAGVTLPARSRAGGQDFPGVSLPVPL